MSILRNTFVGFAARMYVALVGFAATLLIARGIGPAGQGLYYVVLTASTLLATVADLGVGQSAVVFSASREHSGTSLHRAILLIAFGASAPVIALASAAGTLFGKEWLGLTAPLIIATVVLTPLTVYSNFWAALLVGRNRISVLNGVQSATWTVFLALLAAVLATGRMSLGVVVTLHVAVFSGQFLAQMFVASRIGAADTAPAEPVTAVADQMLRFGLRGYVGTLGTVVYLRAGVLILGHIAGPAATGVYSIAHQIAEKFQIAVRAVQDAIYDRVVTLRGDEGLRALHRYVRLSTAAFALLALTGAVLAPVAIGIFFGQKYRGAVLPLQMLLAGSALIGVAVVMSTYFVGHLRKPGVLSWLAAGGAVVAIVLGVIFTRRWQIVGAAAALLTTEVLIFLAASVLYARWSRTRFVDFLIVGAGDYDAVRASLQRAPRKQGSSVAPPPEAG